MQRMLFHDQPLCIRERSCFLQDGFRNGHLANIVQEGASVDMQLFRDADPNGIGKADGNLHHLVSMTKRFALTQFQGTRERFHGGIEGDGKLDIPTLPGLVKK
jgi:hypothetical protein